MLIRLLLLSLLGFIVVYGNSSLEEDKPLDINTSSLHRNLDESTYYSFKITSKSDSNIIVNSFFVLGGGGSDTYGIYKFITAWYDFSKPVNGGGYENILLPTNDPESYANSDNKFYPSSLTFSREGVNFQSETLQMFLVTLSSHFAIWYPQYNKLWQQANQGNGYGRDMDTSQVLNMEISSLDSFPTTTISPTVIPTIFPTVYVAAPTTSPTLAPTKDLRPTRNPTISANPTLTPTRAPTLPILRNAFGAIIATCTSSSGSGCCSLCTEKPCEMTFSSSITSISDNALKDCSSFTSLIIPTSVISIGVSAFKLCTSMVSVSIPTSVTFIGMVAFQACSSLTSVTIPSSMTSLAYATFIDCSSLTSVTIPDSVTILENSVFLRCPFTCINWNPAVTRSIGGAALPSVNMPVCTMPPTLSPTRSPTLAAQTQSKVGYMEIYSDSSCSSEYPLLVSGFILNECQPSDQSGTYSEMMILVDGSELGINSYNGGDCQASNFIVYTPLPLTFTDGHTECTNLESLGEPSGSGYMIGYIADSLSAVFDKYASKEFVINFNYPTATCDHFPTFDITFYKPCQEISENGNTVYFTNTLTATGLEYSLFDDPSCSGEPQRLSLTYAQMEFNVCLPTDDDNDNLLYMMHTTRFFMPTQSPAPTYAQGSPTVYPTLKPSRQPSTSPSYNPSLRPTLRPSFYPSLRPTFKPTKVPSLLPTVITSNPTSKAPTTVPTVMDGISAYYVRLMYTSGNELITERVYYNNDKLKPTISPTLRPSLAPTAKPSAAPSLAPTLKPSPYPTAAPTSPTPAPSRSPTVFGAVYCSTFTNCCNYAANVLIPETVTAIPQYAFNGCSSLKSVSIPNTVTSIGKYAFADSGLTSVVIPESVTVITEFAFIGCSSLKSVSFPNTLTSIERYAFHGHGLMSVVIPEGVTSIGWWSFACTGPKSLTSITVPDSALIISHGVFYYCPFTCINWNPYVTRTSVPGDAFNFNYDTRLTSSDAVAIKC